MQSVAPHKAYAGQLSVGVSLPHLILALVSFGTFCTGIRVELQSSVSYFAYRALRAMPFILATICRNR